MQIRQNSSYWFLLLIPATFICILTGSSTIHCWSICCWTLLFSAGVNYQNYYNMAFCFVFGILLCIQNIQNVSQIIKGHANYDIWLMANRIIGDYRILFSLIQMIILGIGIKFGFRKHIEYRNQIFVNQNQE